MTDKTPTINIAVCDDEKIIRENIMRLIKNLYEDCRVDLYSSGNALLTANVDYDICFLDIQMPGINGIKAAEQIRKEQKSLSKNESVIIFITALKEYMADAFDVKAFHYLVKPIDENKFKDVFSRAITDCLKIKGKAEKSILVKSGNSFYKVFLKDIFYIESRDKKNIINSVNGAMEYYGKMQELENVLGSSFFRCHRCYIVNMEHINRYNSNTIYMINGMEVFLAQKKYTQFVKIYLNYLRSGGLTHG